MAVLMHLSRRTIVMAMPIVLLACSSWQARAAGEAPVKLFEQKIQAGLIYNFLKFTTWPSSAIVANHLGVCLYGGDPFDGYLSPLKGRTAQQYVISIRETHAPDDLAGCNVVVIPEGRDADFSNLQPMLTAKNILTVSPIDRFADNGGIIEMSMQKDRRIHLYINTSAASAAGLSISSRLLSLAEQGR